VRDLLRLFEKLMVLERFGRPDRGDVAEARHAHGRERSDRARRDIAFDDPPVLEAQHVEPLGGLLFRRLTRRQDGTVLVVELVEEPIAHQIEAAAVELRGGEPEQVQIAAVVEEDAAGGIVDDEDAVAGRLERRREQRDVFFLGRTITHRILGDEYDTIAEERLMASACTHIDLVTTVVHPKKRVCDACFKIGAQWVHLRTCQTCGATLCCDSSPNRHASKHARESSHPVIASAEPGERWLYCFPDDAFAEY
jgi:hypothetical protein